MKAPRTTWFGFALAVLGCSDPDYTCSADGSASPIEQSKAIESKELTGQVTLSAQSPVERAVFEIRMANLPRLWTANNSTLHTPSLFVRTEVSYVSRQPEGAELPPVRLLLDNGSETAFGVSSAAGRADHGAAPIEVDGEDGALAMSLSEAHDGLPNGAVPTVARLYLLDGPLVSPILAKIYLHDVLDSWFHESVLPRMRGRTRLVRYADDAVLIFENSTVLDCEL